MLIKYVHVLICICTGKGSPHFSAISLILLLEVWFHTILLYSTISLSDSEAMATLSLDWECEMAFRNRDHTRALKLLQTHIEVPDVPELVLRAIDNDWIDILKLLITQYGYDPQQCDILGYTTALHTAALCGRLHIVQYLHEECNCNVYTTDSYGDAPLHDAAGGGHLDVVQYLHIKCNCNINTINNCNGATPLHRAAAGGIFEAGSLNVVQYLLGCGADAIATDNDGATPLQHACQNNHRNRNVPVIKYLLSMPAVVGYYIKESSCSSPLSGGAENDVAAVYERVQVPHHVGSFVNVFLLGNSGVGKTTLCQAIKNRSRVNIERDGTYVQGVKLHTAGIVPNKLEDKNLGNIIIHDFAGQKEYYSSHAAVLESLLEKSGAVFVVVINLTQDLSQQVRFWSSVFINERQRNLSSECHLIVIGSHADRVREELKRKLFELKRHISNELGDVGYSLLPLDCHVCSEDNFKSFIESLSHMSASIRNKQSRVLSLYCIFLYYVLEEQISKGGKVCCTLEELMSLCNQSQQKGVPLPDDIVSLLKTLHSRSGAGIIYLANEYKLPKFWIVFSKEILLTKVNGVLFAPSSFVEHRDIASNTGIITSSALQRLFPQYSVDMLIGFLKLMKLCEELNKTLLNVPRTNLALRKGNSLLDSDQLLFFPALIDEKRPQDIGGKFKVGWCLKLTSEYSSLIRFLHLLLLRLAFQYSEAVTKCKPWLPPGLKLERDCSVWTSGIHLVNNDGIETVIEQVEGVMMLMSCEEGAEEDMIRLHCELIKTILGLQQEYCPNSKCEEYLLSPSEFQCALDKPSEVARYNMERLKSQIHNNKVTIRSEGSRGQFVRISELLPVEPKRYLEIMDSSSSGKSKKI